MNKNEVLLASLLFSGFFAWPVYLFANSRIVNSMQPVRCTLAKQWLYFLLILIGIRFAIGSYLLIADSSIYGVGKLYPIRIGYPNYGFLQGLPYLVFCILVVINLKSIIGFIVASRWKYVFIWLLASLFMLSFGGIHGGLIEGNIGIANSSEHLADLQLNNSIKAVFESHVDRIAGKVLPSYLAPHSMSHPAGSVVYWHLFASSIVPIKFSVLNVILFAAAFPAINWALQKRQSDSTAMECTVACLTIPAMLIYGRSDDAVFYALAAIVAALVMIAVSERKYHLAVVAGIVLSFAMNLSYAAIVLFCAVFSFNIELPLSKIYKFIRTALPHFLIVIALVVISTISIKLWLGYDWYSGFAASVVHNKGSTLSELLRNSYYDRVINDRVMAMSDFLIFGGPMLFMVLRDLLKLPINLIKDYKFKNLALISLLILLIVNSNGPGEVSRPWGSVFLLIGFYWFPDLLSREDEDNRWWIIKVQLGWALALQSVLNFGW